MKVKAIVLVVLCTFSLSSLVSCGKSAGASSPEDLFKQVQGKDRNQMADLVRVVAPDERPLLAFGIDFALTFATMFSKDKSIKEDYIGLRTKYKLPDNKKKPEINIRDKNSVFKYANDIYGKIDIEGFLKDAQVIMDRIPDSKKSKKTSPYAELQDVKINGDTATGKAVLENKKSEVLYFRKIDGSWYLSIKNSFMKM